MKKFLIEEIWGLQNQPSSRCCSSGLTISEDMDKVYIDAPVPGVKTEDLEVTLNQESRLLTISAQSKLNRENAYYHLRGSDKFCYQVPLSAAIDVSQPIEASCKEGLLTISLNKNRKPEPMKIEVKVA